MNLDPFERSMVRHILYQKPPMTLKGTTILLALVVALVYAAMDCGFF